MIPRHVPLVETTRGGTTECVHFGSIAVTDPAGRVITGVVQARVPGMANVETRMTNRGGAAEASPRHSPLAFPLSFGLRHSTL
jgi:hypothetical protein